jgi:hypothetical protein
MTDEQIIEKIGMQNADEATKQSMLETIKHTVETRLMGTVGEILSEYQVAHLEEMEQQGASKESMFEWLGTQLTNIGELYEAALQSYLDEFVEKQKKFGI